MRPAAPAVLVATLLVLGGCSHDPKPEPSARAGAVLDELRATIRSEVKDADRARQLVAAVDDLERELGEATRFIQATRAQLRALHADYDATPEQFRAHFREVRAQQAARQQRILALDGRAKGLTTPEEWKRFAKVLERAIGPALQAASGT